MSNHRRAWSCGLGMSFALLIVCGSWAGSVLAAGPSTVEDSENSAKHALDAAKVTAFDGALAYVNQEVVAKPAADAVKQISYTIAGPGEGVKSSVEFRIYLTAGAAAAHSNPQLAQQIQEAHESEIPRGQYRTYHSNLSGSDLAKSVPGTFHCMALTSKETWSRCYYYAGADSNVVVVGTTSSPAANEAIMITALGAQTLAAK
jgi:hypothetical protein